MSFLDGLQVTRDGALALGLRCERQAENALYLSRMPIGVGKRTYFTHDWWFFLNAAHYWAMYVMAMETAE